jgi:hypothetical protein
MTSKCAPPGRAGLGRRIGLLVMCIAVAGLLFLNAWQGYRYHTLAAQVAELERTQKELLEKNRDAIADIAREQSPGRVMEKAGAGVAPLDLKDLTRVSPAGAGR